MTLAAMQTLSITLPTPTPPTERTSHMSPREQPISTIALGDFRDILRNDLKREIGEDEARECLAELLATEDADASIQDIAGDAGLTERHLARQEEEDEVDEDVHCECGEITGEACSWKGPEDETRTVDHMPEWLRASHEAAGNSGTYPHNGAQRLTLHVECAERLAEDEE